MPIAFLIRYLLWALAAMPLLPVLYWHGKQMRKRVPRLPEATGPSGLEGADRASRAVALVAIGESTMAGVGVATHKEGFARAMAATLAGLWGVGIAWAVHAKSGYTVRQIVEEIVPNIPSQPADLVVVGVGANDAFRLGTPWYLRRQLERLIHALGQRYGAAPIFFAAMPPIKTFPAFTPVAKFVVGNLVEMYGQTLARLAGRHPNVYYDPRGDVFEEWRQKHIPNDKPEAFFSDGVHPSALTYQIWGEETAHFVADNTACPIVGKGPKP